MGNLRNKYTDEEWQEALDRIADDRKKGKPDEDSISLIVGNMNAAELIRLRAALEDFQPWHQLRILDRWIAYRQQ